MRVIRAIVENRRPGRIGFFDAAGLYHEIAAGASVEAELIEAGIASLRTIFGENIAISAAPPGATKAAQGGAVPRGDTEPAAEPALGPEDAPLGDSGALEAIRGVGPGYARRLRDAGVADIAELAALADAEISALGVSGRVRDLIPGWRDQAREIVDGDAQP